MKDKFVITITDINGSRQFLLSQLIKKFAIYFVIFLISVFLIGAWFISFLMNETEKLEQKREELVESQKTLALKNEHLQSRINSKTKEFQMIEDKILNLEELIGLRPSEKLNLDERLDAINLTGIEQQILFEQIPNGWVIPKNTITAKFGWRQHPILKKKEFHPGLDIRAPIGTPIVAPADGVIEYSGYNKSSGFGYLVIIEHNYGFKTRFAHLKKKTVVEAGQFVKKGDLIGYTGNTGLSTGPHLHYEVRFISRPLDPANFVKWTSSNYEKIFKEEKRVSWQSLIKMMTDQSQHQKPPS